MSETLSDERWNARHRFYNRVVTEVPGAAASDLQRIASAWLDLSGAAWVWIWLHNGTTSEYEIAAAAAWHDADVLRPPRLSPVVTNAAPAIQWAADSGRPLYIPQSEIRTWRTSCGDRVYELSSREWFARKRCRGIQYVPFSVTFQLAPFHEEPGTEGCFRGVVGLYYLDEHLPFTEQHPADSVSLMAKLTGATLVSSFVASQRMLLVKLTSLVAEYLPTLPKTPSLMEPVRTLHEFSTRVAELLKADLQLDGVSLFYRNRENTSVVCVGSTGLLNAATGERIKPKDLRTAAYAPGKGRTGKCYATGEFANYSGHDQTHGGDASPQFREETPQLGKTAGALNSRVAEKNALFCPLMPIVPDGAAPTASGVLRCIQDRPLWDRAATRYGGGKEGTTMVRQFDPIALDFFRIATTVISPAVGALQGRVWRERDIYETHHQIGTVFRNAGISQPVSPLRIALAASGAQDAVDVLCMAEHRTKQLLARLSRSYQPAAPANMALWDQVIDPLLPSLRAQCRFADKTLKIERRPDAACSVWGDVERIQEVVQELCENACRYAPDGTVVVLRVDEADGRPFVEVENGGHGIDPEDEPCVFREGGRGSSAAKKTGQGLGLHIALQIARQLGGELTLMSGKNPTVFRLSLSHAENGLPDCVKGGTATPVEGIT